MRQTALLAAAGRRDILRPLLGDGVRYLGVSIAAFAVDYGLLIVLHRGAGVHYLGAAAVSFVAGLLVAWSGSVAFVFHDRRRLSRWREFGGFCLTGLFGLVLTQIAMMALVDGLSVPAEIAKAPVAAGVFLFNFISRRTLLFAPAPL